MGFFLEILTTYRQLGVDNTLAVETLRDFMLQFLEFLGAWFRRNLSLSEFCAIRIEFRTFYFERQMLVAELFRFRIICWSSIFALRYFCNGFSAK